MLAKRVIPTMLCRGRTLVKGKQFAGDRSIGHVQQAARVHAKRGVDELLILDIGATTEGRGPDLDMVRELSQECYIPLTVGGGVKTLNDIDALLRAGADKVCIGTAAAYRAEGTSALIEEASSRFGRQAIVVSLDWLHGSVLTMEGRVWRQMDGHPWGVVDWAADFVGRGAGEIVLQSPGRDGMLNGYDLDLISDVAAAVDVPVIASGGCSGPEDMDAALKAGADAVAAGALFAFTDNTPRSCAKYLHSKGWEVRL